MELFMELSYKGIQDKAIWQNAGIQLPGYDAEACSKAAKEKPCWVHFGIGNIFRIFLGGIADTLLEKGLLDRGITCVETYDFEVVDKIYKPYDNLALSVVLNNDGSRDYKVLGSLAEAVKGSAVFPEDWKRLKEIFRFPGLQFVSFTITEKGYALYRTDGSYLPIIQKDIEDGPEKPVSAMAVLTAMLLERFRSCKAPISLVSMDNCSRNGSLLRKSVTTIAEEWKKRGYVDSNFIQYVTDERTVAFPWTMIDRITPRPSETIADDLEKLGVRNMQPITTKCRTYIAPFINAEKIQYLVIEDNFPNGRPPLESGYGVYLTDRTTVNLAERMKVTACLNPIHSAIGPLGVLLGEPLFADMLNTDSDMMTMAKWIEYKEDLPVVKDPGIISPEKFADELFHIRFINEYLGDTNLRLCTDESQGLSVRFGETIKEDVAKSGTAKDLVGVPLGIAGWLRYLLGVDDSGSNYETAPDPMVDELLLQMKGIKPGEPESLTTQLIPVLSNTNLFGVDLYKAGLGHKIEDMFREMLCGNGSVRNTVHKYMNPTDG